MLENDQIRLRPLEPEDLEILYQWENLEEIWQHSNTLAPYSKFVLRSYLENAHKDLLELKQLRLIIELKSSKTALGTIDLFEIDFFNLRAGIGILIAKKEHRKKGFAGQSIDLLKNYSDHHLGLEQLFCNIAEDNTNSLQLFQSKGFKITGKKLNWIKSGNTFKHVLFLQHIF